MKIPRLGGTGRGLRLAWQLPARADAVPASVLNGSASWAPLGSRLLRPGGAHAAAAASRRYSATRAWFFRVIGLFSTIASLSARYVATSSSPSLRSAVPRTKIGRQIVDTRAEQAWRSGSVLRLRLASTINVFECAPCRRSWQRHSGFYGTARTAEARPGSAGSRFELLLYDRRELGQTKPRRGTVSDRLLSALKSSFPFPSARRRGNWIASPPFCNTDWRRSCQAARAEIVFSGARANLRGP